MGSPYEATNGSSKAVRFEIILTSPAEAGAGARWKVEIEAAADPDLPDVSAVPAGGRNPPAGQRCPPNCDYFRD